MCEFGEELCVIFVGVLDGILFIDVESGKFLIGNLVICCMFGYVWEEFVDIGIFDIYLLMDIVEMMQQVKKILDGDMLSFGSICVWWKDGLVFYVDIIGMFICVGGKDCLLCMFCDIFECKEVQDRIVQFNCVYVMLSGINMLIVYVGDCDELFWEVCWLVVEVGGFWMFLIVIVDQSWKEIVLVVFYGKDEILLIVIKKILFLCENVLNILIVQVIREKIIVIFNNL